MQRDVGRNCSQYHADLHRGGDDELVHGLRHERDRFAGPARRARRTEAGAPAHPVHAARVEQHVQPAVPQVRPRRRRSDGQVPPARRLVDLRRAGPHGPGLLDALHARRRPGQLRLGRRRSAGGHALHRVPDEQALVRAARRYRQGNRRLAAELRRQGARAHGPADQGSEPPDQWLGRHRRRHGDQHPAPQPGRGHRRRARDDRHPAAVRRTLFDLREARLRREIVEGLGLAVINIDRVIEIIRSSKDTDEAKQRLIGERLGGLAGFLERAGRPPGEVAAANALQFSTLTPRQAQAILEMRLGRLTGLEREKLEAEYKELWQLTDYLEGLLADETKLMTAITDEVRQIKADYADPRRTRIVDNEGEILTEELIDQKDMVVTRTHLGYIKRTPADEYEAQGRGGRGITGATSTEGDFIVDMFAASTHDHVLLFTDKGRAYYKKVFELPEGSRTAKGRALVNVLDLQEGEQVVAMLPFTEFRDDTCVFFATQSGTVKKTELSQFENVRQSGIKAITIEEGDRLIKAELTTKAHDVLLPPARGFAVRFTEDRVRPMGRTAAGVRGISLRADDRLLGMCAFMREDSAATLIPVRARGCGKRTALADYPTKNRGGKGVITIKTTARNGQVCAVRIVTDDDHLILISDRGKLIRMRVGEIKIQGRATQGVRLMRVDDGEHVAAIERLAEPGETSGIAEAAPLEAGDDSDTGPQATSEDQL